jgi:hypothetical protein
LQNEPNLFSYLQILVFLISPGRAVRLSKLPGLYFPIEIRADISASPAARLANELHLDVRKACIRSREYLHIFGCGYNSPLEADLPADPSRRAFLARGLELLALPGYGGAGVRLRKPSKAKPKKK